MPIKSLATNLPRRKHRILAVFKFHHVHMGAQVGDLSDVDALVLQVPAT